MTTCKCLEWIFENMIISHQFHSIWIARFLYILMVDTVRGQEDRGWGKKAWDDRSLKFDSLQTKNSGLPLCLLLGFSTERICATRGLMAHLYKQKGDQSVEESTVYTAFWPLQLSRLPGAHGTAIPEIKFTLGIRHYLALPSLVTSAYLDLWLAPHGLWYKSWSSS